MWNFLKIVVAIGTVVIFVSLVFAIRIRKFNVLPKYLVNFYLYPLLKLLLSIFSVGYMFFGFQRKGISGNGVEKIISSLDFFFWCYFFLELFKKDKGRKYIMVIAIFYTGLIIPLILSSTMKYVNYDIVGYTNIAKCLFCIIYFFLIFKNFPRLNLKNLPSFWIVSGLLFSAAVSTPIFLSIGYLRYNVKSPDIAFGVLAVADISIIIMHLFFIKAYTCVIRAGLPDLLSGWFYPQGMERE